MLLVVHDDDDDVDFDDTFRRFPINRKFQPPIEQHTQIFSLSLSSFRAIDSRSILQGVVHVAQYFPPLLILRVKSG